ncbi:histidine kinase/DNA gyrase B/HSP90-like ATPase [Acidovorax sp. 56]|nr:histidine kinase/DNA gyrase B/HSP90-like ATPase [Acidovorax sp. 56]
MPQPNPPPTPHRPPAHTLAPEAATGGAALAVGVVRHALIVATFCCSIALALTLGGKGPWDQNLVYSLAIGMVSWAVIEAGRITLARHEAGMWPRGWRGIALVAAGTVTGFGAGTALGDLWCQCSTWARWQATPGALATVLVITTLATVAASFFFYSRGTARALQARIALTERDAAEARLKLLETQLEPHMLFNTLANLRVLIALDPARAQAMLDHLIAYLRATLTASRATHHPLADEFDRLRDYLELMAVRMGPRLHYTLDLPEALRQVPVPPLLLQPLVENAIRHGLEPQVAGGHISVRASVQPSAPSTPSAPATQYLVLEVTDTGVGLGHSAHPTPGTAPTASTHFGLAQVRERLATLHGNAGTLDLIAASAGGTSASVRFPLKIQHP